MTLNLEVDENQKYSVWEPITGIQKPMFVDGLYDDYEGFRILLRGEALSANVLRIGFEAHLSYRNTDESFMLKVWNSIPQGQLGEIFYIIENSDYIKSFNEMTGNLYDDWSITHYGIYTTSDCIDIISTDIPTVEWLN